MTVLLNLGDVMRLTAAYPVRIEDYGLNEENRWKGRMLYSLLASLCSGRALGVVRQVPEGHGLEAWRCLVKEYEPEVASRTCAMFTALRSPKFTNGGRGGPSFMDQLLEWERAVKKYVQISKENVGNILKCSVLTSKAPARIREDLRLTPVDYAGNYEELRGAIRNFLEKGKSYGADGTVTLNDPMNVSMLQRGQPWGGKSYGKKGGQKGKGRGEGAWRDLPPLGRAQGPGLRGGCFSCGGPHRQQNCPYQQRNAPRAGKGNWHAAPRQQPQQLQRWQSSWGGGKAQQKGGKRQGGRQGQARQQGRRAPNPDANSQCGKRKRWGHRRRDCRSVNDFEDEEEDYREESALVGGVEEQEENLSLFMIERQEEEGLLENISGWLEEGEESAAMLLLDSGAFTHVCPSWFAPHVKMDETDRGPGGVTASGVPLKAQGTKIVPFCLWDGSVLKIRFVVTQVTKPLHSVGEFQRRGWDICFSNRSYLVQGNKVVPLLRRGGLTYLPAQMEQQGRRLPRAMDVVLAEAHALIPPLKNKLKRPEEQWHIGSEALLREGVAASRMVSPTWPYGHNNGFARMGPGDATRSSSSSAGHRPSLEARQEGLALGSLAMHSVARIAVHQQPHLG